MLNLKKNDMELKEFVKTVITQLVEGVSEAKKEVANKDAFVNPLGEFDANSDNGIIGYIRVKERLRSVGILAFEVGLTSTGIEENSGKVGVFLSIVGVGTESAKSISNEAVTRIKFSIPIVLPASEYSNKENY
jgi:hypothetical protein